MNPEILLSEAKEYVKKELISIGYEPVECGKCGLVVLAGNKKSGKTFLIRADMDALPISEQAEVDFHSKNKGKMHACGHDMLEAGVLENPKTDAALMIHVTLGIPLSTGRAIICDGGISAPSADYFEIKIQGKGCHGAMPELGVDPITIASHIVILLPECSC